MSGQLIKTLGTSARACLLASVMALAWPASADSVQKGDQPAIEGITLIGIEDGELVYRAAAGEVRVPLEDISNLVIESVPAFESGLKAFKEGQYRTAQRDFLSVWQDSRVDWIRHYAGFYLSQAYDERKEPVQAGEVFAKLAADGADLFFLSKPPTKSLAEASEDQKKRITDQIMAVVQTTRGERREKLRTFLRSVAGEAVVIPENDDEQKQNKQDAQRDASAVILPESVWKMLDRKGEKEGKWSAVTLLSEGKYQEALDAIKPWLNNAGDLPEKLFIYGRAQLALADEKNDKGLYQDAGLTFMRIVVHFTRAGQAHPLVAAAQLEVAYIHKKIGREDIYDRLLFGGEEGGGVNLVIDDQQAYPQYRKRYYQVIGETPPAE